MISKSLALLIIGLAVLLQTSCVFSQSAFFSLFMFLRPILQPIGTMQYKLLGVPMSAFHSLILLLYIFTLLLIKRNYTLKNTNFLLLIFFIFTGCLSFIYTNNYLQSINGVFKLFISALVLIFSYNLAISTNIRNVLIGLFASQIIPIFYGFYQKFTNIKYSPYSKEFIPVDRISSVLGDNNDFGIFLVIMFVASLALLFHTNSKNGKFFILLVLILNTICTILSQNRGTWIALSFAIFFASITYYKQLKKYIIIIFFCFLATAILSSGIIIKRFSEIHNIDQYGQSQDTLKGRVYAWKELLPHANKYLFTGIGIENSLIYTKLYFKHSYMPHNDYLRILLEMGIISLIIYIIFLSRIFIISLFQRNTFNEHWYMNYCMLILITYFIVISMVQNPIFNFNNFPQLLSFIGAWDAQLYINKKKIALC